MRNTTLVLSSITAAAFLSLSPSPSFAQGAAEDRQAQQLHEQGVSLFQAARYSEAVRSFEASARLAHNPLNQWNIMRCYQELGDYRRALRALDRYLANSTIPATDRAEGERRRQELRAVRGSSGGAGLVGPWILLGSGVAVLLTGGVLDLVAYLQSDRDGSDQFGSEAAYESWYEGVRNMALAGDVLLGVGAAAAIGGLVWLVVAMRQRSRSRTSQPPVALSVGSDGLMLQTQIRF